MKTIEPYEWVIQEPELLWNTIIYNIKGDFKQFPLKVAYAITIHKSQWLTFDQVFIDLWSFAFAKHMVYVALSRVKKMSWLFLKRSIYYDEIIVDENISKFLQNLEKIDIKY